VVALGLLEVMKSGATTLLDQFRPRQQVILNLAKRWGLRFYGAPYLFSPARSVGTGRSPMPQGRRRRRDWARGLQRLFAEFDEGAGGRIRVILRPMPPTAARLIC
jgi:hypothetical protein